MCKLPDDLPANAALVNQRLFPIQLSPLRGFEKLKDQFRAGFTVNRGYSANRLNIHSILMRHGKRQVLTIRLVFAPGSLNEFAQTGKIWQ
jgi:hypothetical protein